MYLSEQQYLLQQVSIYELGGSHARGLVELGLKQDGDMLRGGGLLVGQAGLRLAQLRALHPGVAVQGGPRQIGRAHV